MGILQRRIWLTGTTPCRGLFLPHVSSSSSQETSTVLKRSAVAKDLKTDGIFTGSLPGCPEPMGATFSADMVSCSRP